MRRCRLAGFVVEQKDAHGLERACWASVKCARYGIGRLDHRLPPYDASYYDYSHHTNGYFSLDFSLAEQFGKAIDEGDGAEPLAVVDGGVAADDFAGCDVAGDAALGGGDGSVAYGAVAGYADLAGEDDVFADGGGAGEADLGAEEGVGADG